MARIARGFGLPHPVDPPEGAAPRTSPGTFGLMGVMAALVAAMSYAAVQPALRAWFVATAVAASAVVVLVWARGDVRLSHVLALALVFRLLLVWLPPALSDDAYRYVWDGLLQAEGINPYRFTPAEVGPDGEGMWTLFEALNSTAYYSVYPPVSQLVFRAGVGLAGGEWPASFFAIKAIFVLLEAGGLLLLSRVASARSLVLYAWHPLVLVEVAGQGHTEAAMVFFLALTFVLARAGRGTGAAAALAAAGWAKLYPFVLMPFLWRRFGWRAVWPAALVTVVVWAPYFFPDAPAHLAASLKLYVRYFEFNAGPYYFVKQVLLVITGADLSKTLGPLMGLAFAASLPLIYAADARRGWSLEQAFLVTLGTFLACSTTVHPWYLLAVLPLAAVVARPAWEWFWLGTTSLGTYLFYVGGSYWVWVWLGWGGWLALALYRNPRLTMRLLQPLQRWRARRKAAAIRDWLPTGRAPLRILDLGAGEGYVGDALRNTHAADVVLADVLDLNRTELPLVCYDGRKLPFADASFDVVVLYFVLHHCEAPETVVAEAARVSKDRVIVVESTYEGLWDHRLLYVLDRTANRLRSGGQMRAQEPFLAFRTRQAWREAFRKVGAQVVSERRRGRLIHRQAFFLLSVGQDEPLLQRKKNPIH